MPDINPITALLLIIAALPIISGVFMQFSREGVRQSLISLFDNLVFIALIFLAIYLTKQVFFEPSNRIGHQIYDLIPASLQTLLLGQDVIIYLVMVPLLLAFFWGLIQPLTKVFNRFIVFPLANALYGLLSLGGPLLKGFTGAVVQIPRAAISVLLLGLGLNFMVYYAPMPALSASMNESSLYQALSEDVLYPLLNSNLAKKIPVIVNDAFAQATGLNVPDEEELNNLDESVRELMKGRVITYFNGVTLDTAVTSNEQIDKMARQIVGREKNDTRKAYLIYRWIAQNLTYDHDKAARIATDTTGMESGSIVAFETRSGICFDYASLYVSMCRAVGLKVRMVTGLAYSGSNWGDHAWNQVYSSEEDRWINVDATFGQTGNYFDKPDFKVDHRYPQVQGEW
ncbi:Transglutaminase-like [Syntrophomonas zehnderi OL-4]|uniref:Transglutaminase-like n=1 Tax=Syntrophomonas zehnderi OL-4 TaxID=690567 RepID=A0A0E4C8D7_9FIRM|nr:transglutaminase-like domain-containing protein [Syntrophomonas zehnderi]CFX43301.1 Transglutaminase-like [Syntrophomonas zehnderi OL-4]